MYRQFKIQQLYFLPTHSMCFVFISEKSVILPLTA